jgi:hypothetical protein
VWGDAVLVDDLDVERSMWDDVWGYDPAVFFGSPDAEDDVVIRITPRRAMMVSSGDAGPTQTRWHR